MLICSEVFAAIAIDGAEPRKLMNYSSLPGLTRQSMLH